MRGGRSLVFVEVKMRHETAYGYPLEAVTPRKQARVRLMAEKYLSERGEKFAPTFDELRFDVSGILIGCREAGDPARRRCSLRYSSAPRAIRASAGSKSFRRLRKHVTLCV